MIELHRLFSHAKECKAAAIHIASDSDRNTRLSYRMPPDGELHFIRWLDRNQVHRLLSEMHERLQIEDRTSEQIYAGRLELEGAYAAAAVTDYADAKQIVIYPGLRSIRDVDRYILDRERVLQDLYDRCVARKDDVRAAVLAHVRTLNSLDAFSLNDFCRERGFALIPETATTSEVQGQLYEMEVREKLQLFSDDARMSEARIRVGILIDRAHEAVEAATTDAAKAKALERLHELDGRYDAIKRQLFQ